MSSDYQLLMEGKMQVKATAKDSDCVMDLTKLMRDLYKKIYVLEDVVQKLQTPQTPPTPESPKSPKSPE
jgi:hypothetical protein